MLLNSASDMLPLNGTGQGENDPGIMLALVRFGDMPCVLLGQDRRGQTAHSPLGPGALREARRGMRLAAELDLPLVTIIDTAGARPVEGSRRRWIGRRDRSVYSRHDFTRGPHHFPSCSGRAPAAAPWH
nr:hypothetical protein [Rhodococcus erythropolis]